MKNLRFTTQGMSTIWSQGHSRLTQFYHCTHYNSIRLDSPAVTEFSPTTAADSPLLFFLFTPECENFPLCPLLLPSRVEYIQRTNRIADKTLLFCSLRSTSNKHKVFFAPEKTAEKRLRIKRSATRLIFLVCCFNEACLYTLCYLCHSKTSIIKREL